MIDTVKTAILRATRATDLSWLEDLQSLWSGYGKISRYRLVGDTERTVIVKQIQPPTQANHPRGWSTSLSHERKLRSYQVESYWYQEHNDKCTEECRTPQCLATLAADGSTWLVLEDLDLAGFNRRIQNIKPRQLQACLSWLAHFHARFLDRTPEGLWQEGTYWHLATRPDELDALDDLPLRNAAGAIAQQLRQTSFLTLVHGDAKLANFCFRSDGSEVAAVDFQYVGGGCGMKDLAYFIGSCLTENESAEHEMQILDDYFRYLSQALARYERSASAEEVEAQWRPLYRVAWADFHRFLKGWSPGHWKLNSYSETVTQQVIDQLS